MEGIAWDWQSLDGAMVKAPLALEAVGKNSTDRGKNGCKRSILTDKNGLDCHSMIFSITASVIAEWRDGITS
jgi:hypothetical protein